MLGVLPQVSGGVLEGGMIASSGDTNADEPKDASRFVMAALLCRIQILLGTLQVSSLCMVEPGGEELVTRDSRRCVDATLGATCCRMVAAWQQSEKMRQSQYEKRLMGPNAHPP
jgi:hypothetical protein